MCSDSSVACPCPLQTLEWILLNSSVALVGYYFGGCRAMLPGSFLLVWHGQFAMQHPSFAWFVSVSSDVAASLPLVQLPSPLTRHGWAAAGCRAWALPGW